MKYEALHLDSQAVLEVIVEACSLCQKERHSEASQLLVTVIATVMKM